MGKQSVKQVASNRKAFHDYFIEDKYEAGIELAGTEVKSIRQGAVNLRDSGGGGQKRRHPHTDVVVFPFHGPASFFFSHSTRARGELQSTAWEF